MNDDINWTTAYDYDTNQIIIIFTNPLNDRPAWLSLTKNQAAELIADIQGAMRDYV